MIPKRSPLHYKTRSTKKKDRQIKKDPKKDLLTRGSHDQREGKKNFRKGAHIGGSSSQVLFFYTQVLFFYGYSGRRYRDIVGCITKGSSSEVMSTVSPPTISSHAGRRIKFARRKSLLISTHITHKPI